MCDKNIKGNLGEVTTDENLGGIEVDAKKQDVKLYDSKTANDRRAFIIVLDSLGIGGAPDAADYGDEGSNTLGAISGLSEFNCPTLAELGLFNVDGVCENSSCKALSVKNPRASYARFRELSKGKDTTIGHWELAGIVSEKPFPVYPNGFPQRIIERFERETGKKTLCNKPYSGTEVIKDYGEQSLKRNALIVYTSADSVFQIAAHENLVAPSELYEYCRVARKILTGENAVGRVIARPFAGEYPFYRTERRHDFSLEPPKKTMLDLISAAGKSVISVGKIYDIFAARGITKRVAGANNAEGMQAAISLAKSDFNGLCFINLVDFDMVYGHRNDCVGYARAMTDFDCRLAEFLQLLRENDLLIITADHGCDPSTPSTDHSRECVPALAFGKCVKGGVNLGTRLGFCDISATVLEFLGVPRGQTCGNSFLSEILN